MAEAASDMFFFFFFCFLSWGLFRRFFFTILYNSTKRGIWDLVSEFFVLMFRFSYPGTVK